MANLPTLPYATAQPRPVVAGSAGLGAAGMAFQQWDRYGAPQLNRRFINVPNAP